MPPSKSYSLKKKGGPTNEGFPARNRKKGKNKNKDHGKNLANAKSRKFVVRPLKDRIRDLRRLLNASPDLPADVKQGYEREIQALQHEVISILVDKEKHEMIGRYHMVRFFERQKATRRLKKANKALEECESGEEKEELARQAHMALLEFNYTAYYPYMTPYHSLMAKSTDKDGNHHYSVVGVAEDGSKGNPVIWKKVEQATKDGSAALEKLRDSIDVDKIEQIRQSVLKVPEIRLADKEAKAGKDEEVDMAEKEDESGVGFFE